MPKFLVRKKGTKKWVSVEASSEKAAVMMFSQEREKDHYSLDSSQKTFAGTNIHLRTVAVDIKPDIPKIRPVGAGQKNLEGKIKKQMKLGG